MMMKFLLGFLLIISCIFASEMDTVIICEKLIIPSNNSEKSLQDLKVYFLKNRRLRILQKKQHFHLVLENFGQERILVIKPIKSREVRNRLLILLSSKFKNMFYIRYEVTIPKENIAKKSVVKKSVVKNDIKIKNLSWINMIDLQWITLFLLSIIGLTLSIQSRKKIAKLGESQVNLKEEQKKIETDIDILGNDDV